MPGGRSTGCSACRSRKVKCDEGVPSCARCVKVGCHCEYRDGLDLAFQHENKRAAKLAKSNWRKRARQASSSSDHHETSQSVLKNAASSQLGTQTTKTSSLVTARQSQPSASHSLIVKTPEPLYEQLATGRFFADYIIKTHAIVQNVNGTMTWRYHGGHFDFLPALYQRSKDSECLRHTVTAVALGNFANRYNLPALNAQALESYCKGLVAVKSAVQNHDDVGVEGVLTSILLLGLFETITNAVQDGTWANHVRGGITFLMARYKDALASAVGQKLTYTVHTQALLSCLAARKPIPSSLVQVFQSVAQELPEGPECESIDIFKPGPKTITALHELSHLVSEIQELLQPIYTDPTGESSAKMEMLIHRSLDLDRMVEMQEHQTPLHPGFDVVEDNECTWPDWFQASELAFRPKYVHIYPTVLQAMMWNMYRGVRICLNHAIFDGISSIISSPAREPPRSHLGSSWEELLSARLSIITHLVEGVSCSAWAIFSGSLETSRDWENVQAQAVDDQGVRGYAYLWPLRMASWACSLTPEMNGHRQWIVAVLEAILHTMGIARADAILNTMHSGLRFWTPPSFVRK